MALLTGCVSGSLPVEYCAAKVRAAGFEDVETQGRNSSGGRRVLVQRGPTASVVLRPVLTASRQPTRP